MRTIVGLENKRSGKLLIIKKVDKKWECLCDCGRTCYIKAAHLTKCHITSCGCKKRPILIGKKFGRLTVLRFVGKNRNGKKLFECRCDCGKTINAISSKLASGKKQSCGCLARENFLKRQWKGYGEISGSYWTRVLNQARSRNLEVSITIQEVWDLFLKQEKKCNLTGLPLSFSSGYTKNNGTASLDRINSKLGYTRDNVQWIHKYVNQMKMDLDEKTFVELCRKIVETHDLKENTR